MKIGILTIHHAYNFGAMLQSYATYRTLTELGHDVEFINYDNKTFSEERLVLLPFNSLGNILRNIRSLLQYKHLKARIQKYEIFYAKSKVSTEHYTAENINTISQYDIVLTGSDQTFSLYLTGNPADIRPYFQPDIKNVKKISYASSMGEKFFKLTQEDNHWMKQCFQNFDCISVREVKSADYIENITGKRPEIVLDPTLLLDSRQWEKEMVDTEYAKGDYIAFYTVLSEPWVIKYVEGLAAKTGLMVIALHPRTRYEMKTNFKYVAALGPSEFLSVIKNAKYVITTSFHATVFSIVFQKKFASLCIGEGNRQKTLLATLGLTNQLVEEVNNYDLSCLEVNIDYKIAFQKLTKERDRSINYLKNALQKDHDKH